MINLSPLLNKLAAKPLTSPVIPPPIAIKQSFLEKFLSSKILRIEFVVFWFLFFSLAWIKQEYNFLFFKDFFNLIIKVFGTFLSIINKHFLNFIELFFSIWDIFEIKLLPIIIGYLCVLV